MSDAERIARHQQLARDLLAVMTAHVDGGMDLHEAVSASFGWGCGLASGFDMTPEQIGATAREIAEQVRSRLG